MSRLREALQLSGRLVRLGHRVMCPLADRTLPYKLEFFVTRACACHCRTCKIWREPAAELDAGLAEKAAASLSDRLHWIGFSGGEACDREDFPDLAERVVRAARQGVMVNFGTNGLRPGRVEKTARRLMGLGIPFLAVAVSLDGLGKTHDLIRAHAGAFESASETLERLSRLVRKWPHFSVVVQTTLSSLNAPEAFDIRRHILTRHPRATHLFTPALPSHQVGEGTDPEILAGRALAPLVRELARQAPARTPSDWMVRSYLGHLAAFLATQKSPIPCSAGRDMLVVDPTGRVFPCDHHPNALGHLADFDGNIKELVTHPESRKVLDRLVGCDECFTPCQAFPSMIRSPSTLLGGLAGSL